MIRGIHNALMRLTRRNCDKERERKMDIQKINEQRVKTKNGKESNGALYVRQTTLSDGSHLKISAKGWCTYQPSQGMGSSLNANHLYAIGNKEVRQFLEHGDVKPFVPMFADPYHDAREQEYKSQYEKYTKL